MIDQKLLVMTLLDGLSVNLSHLKLCNLTASIFYRI